MRPYCICFFLLILTAQSVVLHANEKSLFVQQPIRSFGYTVGDVLEQRIHLKPGYDMEQWQELLPLQRVDDWIERQSSTVVDNGHWLELRYQIINSPTSVVTSTLPALEFPLNNQDVLSIEAWSFSIAPLIPAVSEQSTDLPLMQADTSPTAPASDSAERNLMRLAVALLAVVALWLLWWLWQNRRDATHLPFARAYLDLRKFDSHSLNENKEAWIIMHHAFNQTAGRTVSSNSVDELTKRMSWLQALSPRINDFFSASAQRFFAQSKQTESFDLLPLCKALYLAEKKYLSGVYTNNKKRRPS